MTLTAGAARRGTSFSIIVPCCILCCLLCAATSAWSQEIIELDDSYWSTEEIVVTQSLEGRDVLRVKSSENLSGKLVFEAAPANDSIAIVYTKQARTDSRSRAVDYIDLISVELQIRPQDAELELRAPNPAPWSKHDETGLVSATVRIPEGFRLQVDAYYHDLEVIGPLRAIMVPSSLGRIEVTDVHGEVDVATANRRVDLTDVSGFVQASTSNARIRAQRLNAVGGLVRLRNEGGDITVDGIQGEVNIRNSYGRIEIREFEPGGESSVIRNSSGRISLALLRMIEGQLVVSNRHEDVEITAPEDLSAFLSLSVGDGEIECTGLKYTPELVQDSRMNLITGAGDVDISATIRGKGNIYLRGAKGE
jgi:hypothetical protein